MLLCIKEQRKVDTPCVCTIHACLTHWTVCADTLDRFMSKYESHEELWSAAQKATSDTDMQARIQSNSSQMHTFVFLLLI